MLRGDFLDASSRNLVVWSSWSFCYEIQLDSELGQLQHFRAEKRSAQASAHPLSQAQGGLFLCWQFCVCLFVTERVLNETHKVWTFASRNKPFYFCVVFVFRHLKITLDSEQPMLKEKRIIPSVWGGIKSFEHFQRGEYFSDCSFDLFVSRYPEISPSFRRAELKPAFFN